jgi:hypothetical protein
MQGDHGAATRTYHACNQQQPGSGRFSSQASAVLLPDAQDVSIDILRAQLAPTLPDTDDDDCNAHRGHENVRFVAALPRLLAGIMHRVLVLCVFSDQPHHAGNPP